MPSFSDLPKEIRDALNLVWEFADDASTSVWSKEEFLEEGYDCQEEYGHHITFTISKIRKNKSLKSNTEGKYE